MLGNLLRPWLLAELVAATVAAGAAVIAAAVALEVLRAPRLRATNEGQLVLERRAELVSSLFSVGAVSAIVALALAVLGADRLSASIRGAMCAYGVLDATPWGFRALGAALVTAVGCAGWLSLHRLGLALEKPDLVRLELLLALGLAPLALVSLGLSIAHALSLDFRVVASCCSSGLEDVRAAAEASAGGPRTAATTLFFAAGAATIALSLSVARAPSRARAIAASTTAVGAGVAAVPAITWWVAPHAYGSPAHLCPFCLLHAEGTYLGYPLGALLFLALARATGLAAFALLSGRTDEGERLLPEARRVARTGAAAWAGLLVVAALPWARFWAVTGGASLFG